MATVKFIVTVNNVEKKSVTMREYMNVTEKINFSSRFSCVAEVIETTEVNVIVRVCTTTIICIT